MLDHKEILKELVIGTNEVGAVTIRETNFGYIIRSDKTNMDSSLREMIVRFALVSIWIAVAGVWLMPVGDHAMAIKAMFSVGLVAGGCLLLVLSRRGSGGYELHVDTSRRELRSAVLTAKGEAWIRSSARFAEVSSSILSKSRPQCTKRSLSLRIVGESEVMPVAVGEESMLLAVHDRLMRDLRPIEERLAENSPKTATRGPAGRAVFPRLGPEESMA